MASKSMNLVTNEKLASLPLCMRLVHPNPNPNPIVKRGGRCLLPVFALGRAQELLLILGTLTPTLTLTLTLTLDEYWAKNPELHQVPIYYASTLAKKCMTVYQTYINMMNQRIRDQFAVSNPFIFQHISNLKSMVHFEDSGPCVVMASPGMP
jgi:cleavage and polyadenylation specificity factor subunit 3